MCGFTGVYGAFDKDMFDKHIQGIREEISRRGPDQLNRVNHRFFSAFHARLVIQGDERDGVQPFEYRNSTLLYNGNLYNKDDIKKRLRQRHHELSGVSDTQVVAAALKEWGSSALEYFNGFFAIAFFDHSDNTLLLARDKLGQKPLYFHQNRSNLFFGSTTNLLPVESINEIRNESFTDFVTYGFVPAPYTMYKDVYAVEPGSYLKFGYGNNRVSPIQRSRYWKPTLINDITTPNDAVDLISENLDKIVREGLVSSAKVGCLFSGGIDSSLLFTAARKVDPELLAITADFGAGDDAASRALPISQFYNHQAHLLKFINAEDVEDSLKCLNLICDQPFDDTSIIPSNIVFSNARAANCPVVITGDGADELFSGYPSFSKLKSLTPLLHRRWDFIRYLFRKTSSIIPVSGRFSNIHRLGLSGNQLLLDLSSNGFKLHERSGVIDSDYDPSHHVLKIIDEYKDLDPLSKFRILNLVFKLPNQMLYKVDRASMYNSVEARALFLNDSMVEAALRIDSSVMLREGPKSILRSLCKSRLPTKDWERPKTGFGWKTTDYQNLFTKTDNEYLRKKTGIDGMKLLSKKGSNLKRAYFLLHSLASWLQLREPSGK